MDRRSEPRIEVDQCVEVSILGRANTSSSGRVVSISGGGLGVLVDSAVPVGEAIQVNLPGHMLLGEVRHCSMESGMHRLGVELIQRLTLEDLESVIEQFQSTERATGA